MQTAEWLKPGLFGAVYGAVALAVVGFVWGGWVTKGTARAMAAEQSKSDVVAALSLICVAQSQNDPQHVERAAAVKSAHTWERSGIVSKNGWATIPGTSEPNGPVARQCAEKVGM
ncbi:MAG TPA: hypothetical protein VIL09_05235 [Microvirga sp.]|jgi:cytochrome b